jgi:hypothetical protein
VLEALLVIALALGACWVVHRIAFPPKRPKTLAQLKVELRNMTHDAEVATRLVERMRQKHPAASEARLVALAIAELKADRRR